MVNSISDMSLEAVVGVVVFASVMGIWGGAAVSRIVEHDSGSEVAERFNSPIRFTLPNKASLSSD